jgi:signal transduction histidine kinase/transcriptional regulator with GAF, ATPase, and Fis domain
MKTELTNLELPVTVWKSLHKIDNLLGQPLSWEKRLEEISNNLINALDVEAIWLLTIQPLPPTACGLMRTPLSTAPDAKVQMVDKVPPIEENWPSPDSLLSQVIARKKPYFIQPNSSENGQTDSDLGDVLFGTLNATPSAIVPLIANDNPIGALVIGSDDPNKAYLSEDARSLLTYLGEHLGTNLQNAYLVEHSQRHTDILRGLNLIAHTITSSLDIDEVIQRTMAGINKILDVEAGSLLLVDEQTDELYFKITLRGENKQITSYRLQPGEGIAGWVVANNQPVISNNAQNDKRFTAKIDEAIGFITRMVLCVPLIIRGKPIGALEVLNKYKGSFDEDDQELLVSMAASLGIALKNADLYQEAQERARRTEIINHITTVINTGHGLSETGKLILEQFSRFLPFDHISLSLLDNSRENIRQWVFTEHGSLEYTKLVTPLANSALAWIIENNQARIDENLSKLRADDLYPDDQILLENNVKSRIAVPLISQKLPYGSLNLGHQQPGIYGPLELEFLEQLMPQISVTIEKSWLIDVMEQHNIELRGLNHLSEMLFSTTDFRLIIDTATSMLPRLLPGDIQGVIIAEKRAGYLGMAIPFDFTQTDEVIADIIDIFNQISEDNGSTEITYAKTLAGNIPVSADWKPDTVLHLPILTRLGPAGIVFVVSGKKENVSDEVWRTFSLTAAQISTAVENARLFQQVEQERARLAAILSSSTDAVLAVNRDGLIVLDNPAAWPVMGVEESQSGKLLSESTANKTLVQLFESTMQGGKPTGEVPTMDQRTFFANLSPVSAGDAGVIGWVATMQDVSHFAELNQMKDDFVSTVSHDLRAPLSAILIANNLMPQMGELNEHQQELVQTIENRVASMQQLIDNLLDVGRIEAGIDMDMEPCPLIPLINEVTTSLTPQANDKSIELVSQISEPLPLIMANATRIRQVIHNLVDNAIKYTLDQGQTTIKAFPQDKEVRIQVSDTGLGISAADQPHVFEKFHRVKGEYAAAVKGTGLGLAITKSIVEKHNGRIWLESTPGEGSTFTVALPIYEE